LTGCAACSKLRPAFPAPTPNRGILHSRLAPTGQGESADPPPTRSGRLFSSLPNLGCGVAVMQADWLKIERHFVNVFIWNDS
jgi:hypothetical protein